MQRKYKKGDLIVYVPPSSPKDFSDINIILGVKESTKQYEMFSIKDRGYDAWQYNFVEDEQCWRLLA